MFSKAFALELPAARNERRGSSNAKCSYPKSAERSLLKSETNKWQGPASGGKDAVYVGFVLEQA